MVAVKKVSLLFLLRFNGLELMAVVVFACITWLTSIFIKVREPTTLLPSIAVFGTILSLFLAFKTNEAYSRWWEARTLWGQMVNSSRTFARQVLNLITLRHSQSIASAEELSKLQKELIYRHLGYINALRLALRRQDQREELKTFLSEEEMAALAGQTNWPTQIIQKQAARLKEIFDPAAGNDYRYIQFDNTLNDFYNIQGGCERIKNTIFPRIYSFFTTAFTWLFAFGLVFSLFDEFDWQVLVVRTLVAYVFVSLEKIGRFLKDPFENRLSDTPLSALCRTIEIDLREMLGEKNIPLPLKPVKGVLY